MRPDEALKILAVFEGKLARLKEERDNLAKAKEALELAEPGDYQCLCYYLERQAPYWSNPPVLIFDIRALWRSGLSARAPECRKSKTGGLDQYGKVQSLNGMDRR